MNEESAEDDLTAARPATKPVRASDIDRVQSGESIERMVDATRNEDDFPEYLERMRRDQAIAEAFEARKARPRAELEAELARRVEADNGNRTDLDEAITAFSFDRAELEAELDGETTFERLGPERMEELKALRVPAVEAHKARMRAEDEARRQTDLAYLKWDFHSQCRRDGLVCKDCMPRSRWCDLCDKRDKLLEELYAVADEFDRSDESVWQWLNAPTTYLPHRKKPIDYVYSNPDLVIRAARALWSVE